MPQPHETFIRAVREQIREHLQWNHAASDAELMERIEEAVFQGTVDQGLEWTSAKLHEMIQLVYHSFRGMDVLQPLLDNPEVTEIMVNSDCEIFVEQAGRIQPHEGRFESREKLEDLIQSIVAKVNRVVNEANPIVDARLPDGSRVHVVLPPVALKGPTVTIRKFPGEPLRMENLIAKGALHEEADQLLRQLVRAKYNIFISGGTGSGKTTFLNALCGYIPNDERVITIEDSAELQLTSVPNWVRLETRNANTEGKGHISIRELIRSSLRMRPNRIIVGEVRGAEALDMLMAMNTGHEGSLSTGHANSVIDMLSRLESMVLSGTELPLAVVRKQIASAVDIWVHLSRYRDGSRKVAEITEMAGLENGDYRLNPLYRFENQGENEDGGIAGRLQSTGQVMQRRQKLIQAGIAEGGEALENDSRSGQIVEETMGQA
ncbi:CpaF family protein [Paenibacillus koleovorans]|uniref:CpaF family protein n=1 Tax=Paenibacillus koleovorans TaxID=121608 RepID=UPI000FD9504D|nr:CpaF family protein [Paenibacillus koleovorans]